MVKLYDHFQTKTHQKTFFWGCTYIYSLYKGVGLLFFFLFPKAQWYKNQQSSIAVVIFPLVELRKHLAKMVT